jgi:nicotinamidase-related amidase
MAQLDINVKTTALLVMDCQEGIVGSLVPEEKEKLLRNLGKAIQAARAAGMTIIYIVVQFREGYPEISEKNMVFRAIKETKGLQEGTPGSRICAELSSKPGEVIVTKKRISAFSGSDLEALLRAKEVDTLVLTGVSTLGVVESTARFASDMDYRIIVLGDCCSDRDLEAHQAALKWFLPRITVVSSASDFERAIVR